MEMVVNEYHILVFDYHCLKLEEKNKHLTCGSRLPHIGSRLPDWSKAYFHVQNVCHSLQCFMFSF